jgi:predicted TIM-barrel fold metal-dependent hydrolase
VSRALLLILGVAPLLISCASDEEAVARAAVQTRPVGGRAVFHGDEVVAPYEPAPALVTKVTEVPRAKFPVIDIHCHWRGDMEPEALLAAMDERNVAYAVNLSGGSGRRLAATLEKFDPAKYPRLITFANIDYSGIDRPEFGEEVRAYLADAKARGVKGVKIAKNLGLSVRDASGKLVPVDDPRLDPMWAAAGELGLPVLVHSADPVAFFQPVDENNERWLQLRRHPDWSFYGPEHPPRDEVLAQFDRVVEKHPGTTFIAAHLGNYAEDLSKLGERLEKYPNLYADISAREAEWGRQPYTARKFFIRWADRLLFGTDRYPGREDQPRYRIYFRMLETDDEYFDYYDHPYPPTGEWKVYGLFLPDDVLRKIYHDNAAKLLGLPPLP